MNTESTYKTESKSIKTAMDEMGTGKYVIPLIQRDFVWPKDKIEFLFDSILIGYPINALLLCPISQSDDEDKYYKFQKQIGFNMTFNSADKNKKFSVLDGQQRLTSIYSSLEENGMYKSKVPYKQKGQCNQECLYINLTHSYSTNPKKEAKSSEEIPRYCISFFKNDKNPIFIDGESLWMRFSTIYKLLNESPELVEIEEQKKNKKEEEDVSLLKEQAKSIINTLFEEFFVEQFKSLVTTDENISIDKYINEFTYDILYLCYIRFFFDEILNCIFLIEDSISETTPMEIFVRLNKGVPISYSDLLLTRLTSYFQEANKNDVTYKRDAKQRIKIDISDYIFDVVCGKNSNGFKPDIQNILKTFLVINSCEKAKNNSTGNGSASYSDIGFENIEKIDDKVLKFFNENWSKIKETIIQVYKLVWDDLEINMRGHFSYYSFIPLVMFFWLMEIDTDIKRDNLMRQTKQEIKWYIISARMNTVFSGAADTILTRICRQIHASYDKQKGSQNAYSVFHEFYTYIKDNAIESTSFKITKDDIETWISKYKKKDKQTYVLLSLLYPSEAEPNKNTEVDHIHPQNPNPPYGESEHELKSNINGLWNCRLLVKNNPNGKKGNASKGNTPLIELYDADSNFKDLLLSEKEINDADTNNDGENLLSVKKWKDFRTSREKVLNNSLSAILISDNCENMPIKGFRPEIKESKSED